MTEEKKLKRRNSLTRVASGVELKEVRLRYLTTILGISAPERLPGDWASKVELNHDAELVSTDDDSDDPLGAETTEFIVSIQFRAEYELPDESDPEGKEETQPDSEDEEAVSMPDVGIFAMYELRYSLSNGAEVSSRDLRTFARVNSVFNCWPYWRELAHSITQRMNLTTPLIVPVRTVNALSIENEPDPN